MPTLSVETSDEVDQAFRRILGDRSVDSFVELAIREQASIERILREDDADFLSAEASGALTPAKPGGSMAGLSIRSVAESLASLPLTGEEISEKASIARYVVANDERGMRD